MIRKIINLNKIIGKKYNRLTILKYFYSVPRTDIRSMALCLCDCGKKKIIRYSHVISNRTQSCGCLHLDKISSHGLTDLREYHIWADMKNRCSSPSSPSFKHYGGRGIKVCKRWIKFENFLEDMGKRPTSKHSLDRIDVNGNYIKSNCRWTTQDNQASNRRGSKPKVAIKCDKCGKLFFKSFRDSKSKKHSCSYKCRTQEIKYECKLCNKHFLGMKSNPRIFCNAKCYFEYRNKLTSNDKKDNTK